MGWHYLRDHSQACRGATPVLSLVLPVVHAGPSQQAPLVLRITVAGPAVPRKSATGPYRGREPLVPATEVDPLDWVLDTLSALATPSDGQALDALRARISTRRLRVLVAGEAKRGKSTLLNRLLGVDVLPVGVVPVTAIATTVRRWRDSTEEFLIVRFDDGHLARRELDALPDFVTETGNPNNRRRVDSVEVLLGAGPLDEYDVELVDTPGTGSVFEHNTLAARDAIQSLDAAIFVVTADPPISAAERDLLQEVAELSVHTFVVLNKADQLDAADLQEAVQFTQSVCSALSGSSTTVFPCSARKGPSDPGYVHFSAELKRYLAAHACADVDAALRGHLRRLAGGMLDGAVLTQRSVQLAATASADQVRLFSERVADVAGRQQELDDRCWAIERGLRRSLDQSAARVRPQVTKICQAAATATLDGELAELAPDALEEQGRQFVIELIRDHVDRWRVGEADILEAGLTAVCDRVAEESERQLAELRDAAHALLDVTLVTQPPPTASTQPWVLVHLRPANRIRPAPRRGCASGSSGQIATRPHSGIGRDRRAGRPSGRPSASRSPATPAGKHPNRARRAAPRARPDPAPHANRAGSGNRAVPGNRQGESGRTRRLAGASAHAARAADGAECGRN